MIEQRMAVATEHTPTIAVQFTTARAQRIVCETSLWAVQTLITAKVQLQDDPRLQSLLRELRRTQKIRQSSRQLLDLTNQLSLTCIENVFVSNATPKMLTDQFFTRVCFVNLLDVTQSELNALYEHDLFRLSVEKLYGLMLEGRLAIEALDLERVDDIITKLRGIHFTQSFTDVFDTEAWEVKEVEGINAVEDTVPRVKDKGSPKLDLNDVSALYVEEKILQDQRKAQTEGKESDPEKARSSLAGEAKKYARYARTLAELIGPHDLFKLERSTILEVMTLMYEYPNTNKNRKQYEGLSAREMIEHRKKINGEKISPTTVSRYFEGISSIVTWAQQNLDNSLPNRFQKVTPKRKSMSSRPRMPFNRDDLVAIFSQSVFTFEESTSKRNGRPTYQYWAPIIALYSGLRPNEISQLKVKNIQCDDGIWYFDINKSDQDQRLKNKNAERQVPIHSELIRLGLLRYIEGKEGNELLLSGLSRSDKKGYYGNLEAWFDRNFTQKQGWSKQGKSFGSFRHTFTQFFKDTEGLDGEVSPVVSLLKGHERKDSSYTAQNYGHGKQARALERKQEKIETIHYDFIQQLVKPYLWLK